MALSPLPPSQAVLLYCDVGTNGAVTYVGHTPDHEPWLGASVTELPDEVLAAFCDVAPAIYQDFFTGFIKCAEGE